MQAVILNHKDGECIGHVISDEGWVHFAIQLGRSVIAFECIQCNYPATSVAFYKTRQNWINAIKDVDWIVQGLHDEKGVCSPECPKELKGK